MNVLFWVSIYDHFALFYTDLYCTGRIWKSICTQLIASPSGMPRRIMQFSQSSNCATMPNVKFVHQDTRGKAIVCPPKCGFEEVYSSLVAINLQGCLLGKECRYKGIVASMVYDVFEMKKVVPSRESVLNTEDVALTVKIVLHPKSDVANRICVPTKVYVPIYQVQKTMKPRMGTVFVPDPDVSNRKNVQNLENVASKMVCALQIHKVAPIRFSVNRGKCCHNVL